MRIFARISLVVVLVLIGIGHPTAQTATLSGDLLTDWRQQKRMMMGIAEAMPEEMFSFKPTEAQRTYAEQILHIAGANVYLMQHLGGAASAPEVDTLTRVVEPVLTSWTKMSFTPLVSPETRLAA